MSTTLLFTFEDNTSKEKFTRAVNKYLTLLTKSNKIADLTTADIMSFQKALSEAQHDPEISTDANRTYTLYVSGRKFTEGKLAEMKKKFRQEIDAHSGSVELRIQENGKWKSVLSRKLQK